MAIEFDWEGFRAIVRRLDLLLAGEAVFEDYDTLPEACRRTLSFLYTAGVSMPPAGDIFEDAGDAFWEGKLSSQHGETDPARAEAEIDVIAQYLRAGVLELQGDVEAEDIEELSLTAARGLWDVRETLSSGTHHFDGKRLHEAAWEWAFGFDEWGAHALSSLTALHDLLWGAR